MINKSLAKPMATFSGKLVNPFNLKPGDICIEDIAHNLSNICRYGGSTKRFYSVAEHCCWCAAKAYLEYNEDKKPLWYKDEVEEESRKVALVALLHDAAEAYLGDIPRPLKSAIEGYEEVEKELLLNIFKQLDLDNYLDYDYYRWCFVMKMDNLMLQEEMKDSTIYPLAETIGGINDENLLELITFMDVKTRGVKINHEELFLDLYSFFRS